MQNFRALRKSNLYIYFVVYFIITCYGSTFILILNSQNYLLENSIHFYNNF